jgi:hypothetical protein
MALSNVAIIERILGAAMLAARRQAILDDFLSEGLDKLENMSEEDVRKTCSSYAKKARWTVSHHIDAHPKDEDARSCIVGEG